jgi:hypothetical protein
MNDQNPEYSPTTQEKKIAFGRAALPRLLEQGGIGFDETRGYHIYCELRPASDIEFANDDTKALKHVQIIEEFTNHGVQSAAPFKVTLLELQGNVLHFYKEAELSYDSAVEAIQFVFLFTTTLYEELKPELGNDWVGFASCMAHGPAIVLRHEGGGCSSIVSLGPAANRPAKQLLYGKTPASCVDVPGGWAKMLGVAGVGDWYTVNLRDREQLPFASGLLNENLRSQQLERIRAFRGAKDRARVNTISKANRIQGVAVQADLDGFSATVQKAFVEGAAAVERVALGFAKILEFGDYMRQSTPNATALPWAGDRAPTLVPKLNWLDFSLRWQEFAGDSAESKRNSWAKLFSGVSWAIGACHGRTGSSILVPIQAQGRRFWVAAGWPVAVSMEAQNLGKGGDIVIHNHDYNELDAATKRLFSKITGTEFWKTTSITRDKISRAAIEIGKSKEPSPADYLSKLPSIQVPKPRPHAS